MRTALHLDRSITKCCSAVKAVAASRGRRASVRYSRYLPLSRFVAGTAPQTYAQITDSLRAASGGHRRSSSSEGFGSNGAAAGIPEPSSSADGYFGISIISFNVT